MNRRARAHRSHADRDRRALVDLLEGGRAHAPLSASLAEFPRALRGKRVRGAPHTPWELLEHLRIAQRDILDFSRDPEHPSPPWPEGYWPAEAAPPGVRAWEASARAFLRDLATLKRIARTQPDLGATIPGTRTSWLRQLYLVANHNSYHLGQLFLLRRLMVAVRGAGPR
jgi:hypothetical protein